MAPSHEDVRPSSSSSRAAAHNWSWFPKPLPPPIDMNILSSSDRRGRFDIPGLFSKASNPKLADEIDFQGPAEVKDIPFRRSTKQIGHRRTPSIERTSSRQDNVRVVQVVTPHKQTNTVSIPNMHSSDKEGEAKKDRTLERKERQERIERQVRQDREERQEKAESSGHDEPHQHPSRRSHSPGMRSVEATTVGTRSSSAASYHTEATSLPALQQKGHDEYDMLTPLHEEDLDPGSFDLVAAPTARNKKYSLERRSEMLFSTEHLKIIFDDPSLLLRFTSYLNTYRRTSIPMMIYWMDAVKALKAISYSNAIAEALDHIEGFDFTRNAPKQTINADLEEKIKQSFEHMVREDLPAYVTHIFTQTVSLSIQRRITGTLPVHLREASEGLAEVFCLTDPSRPDNPIVFSSEEFHRTTQYGLDYVIGRNCRFLQGPKTNPFSVRRIREKIEAGKEHCEVFLNYRRDGSPFMNLLMCAPLCDSRGTIRYFIGAQVDVSGLVKECSDLESLRRLAQKSEPGPDGEIPVEDEENVPSKDEFQELSEMLNLSELDTVRRWGGRMHKETYEEGEDPSKSGANWNKPRLVIGSISPDGPRPQSALQKSGQLSGIYENYLLIRPYPSLRILFASPSLRVPGILQSPFMKKIGGSSRVREELTRALADGRGVTAKVRWISKADTDGRNRWIHCTPLIGHNGDIGVWMIVLVDDEDGGRKFRQAPPVDPKFGRATPFGDENTGSLRSFAIDANDRGRAPSAMSTAQGTDRSGSPYTLRFD